jgi:hypothetical protein
MIEIFPPEFSLKTTVDRESGMISYGPTTVPARVKLVLENEDAMLLTKLLIEELRKTMPIEDLLQELNLI